MKINEDDRQKMLTPVDSAGGIRKGGSSEVDESLADDTNTPKIEFCLRIIRGTQNGPQRKFHGTICFYFALVLDTQKTQRVERPRRPC